MAASMLYYDMQLVCFIYDMHGTCMAVVQLICFIADSYSSVLAKSKEKCL